jgi:CRISPR/Cas system-associated exonuclease Cas4 (RecB family)
MKMTTIGDLEEFPGLAVDMQWSVANFYSTFFENPPQGATRDAGIHASEIAQCLRQSYYSLTGAKKHRVPNPDMDRRFEIGHALHEMVQRQFRYLANMSPRTARVSFEAEVRTNNTPYGKEKQITSSCDGIFSTFAEDSAPIYRIVLEIKTIASAAWKGLKAPDPKHVDQAHVYMKCFDIPFTYFMYLDKESGKVTPSAHPFMVPFDKERWTIIEQRIQSVLDHRDLELLPEPTHGFHCNWCPYEHDCRPFEKDVAMWESKKS